VRFYTQPFLDYQPNAPIDLLGIIAWSAETERKQTLDRTQGNRQRLRANGLFVEGHPPFGYTVQDRKLVIVPEHAEIVRRIYNDSRDGISVRHISQALLAEYPSIVVGREKKRIMRWTVNNILKILRNRLYTGYMETMGRGRRLRKEQGSGTWLQTHEAIIEPALFEEVAQGLVARRRAGHTVEKTLTGDFLLKHIAKCSVCGHTLRARQEPRSKRGDGAYYQCAKHNDPTKYKDRTPCPNATMMHRRAADDAAEALVLARLESMAGELAAQSRPKPAEPAPDWKRLAAELAAARANVVRLVSRQVITEEDAARQLTEFKREEEMLEARRARWEREQSNDTEEARRATFAKLTEYRSVWARLAPADRRELISELAARVTITPTGEVKIEWRPVASITAEMGATPADAPMVSRLPAAA
jgi:hypothetical protein